MLDLKWIREQPEAFDRALARRGLASAAAELLAEDQRNRACLQEVQALQARRNEASRLIGEAKRSGGDAGALMAEVAAIKERLPQAEAEQQALEAAIQRRVEALPNILAEDVPEGSDESANLEIRRWGQPAAEAGPDHVEIGESLGLLDLKAAADLSGTRFVVLKGALARLERAIGQYFLDLQVEEFGYTEVNPPLLVLAPALFGTGQLPKFEEDQFKTQTGHYLIPTSEVPLTNLVADRILDEAALPLRFTALTPCFRAEAGSAGRDTRGMLRQHQFMKVEMVGITTPEQSDAEQQRMLGIAESLLQRLDLPYRVMLLSTGDTGFASARTYDLEVWLPGQSRYREISSVSTCRDFQARRMKARYRDAEGRIRPLHTLNGSGLAVGRCLIAVLENHRQSDGRVRIPEPLLRYMGGLTHLSAAPAV